MTKKIKCFLLTSAALGFLQLESLAMNNEEADNNAPIRPPIRQAIVQERRETDDLLHNELTRIRENATGFSISIEGVLSSILTRLQQQSEDIRALIQENRDLRTTVSVLQNQINPSRPLRAAFKHSSKTWQPYTNADWEPVTFNLFDPDGDQRLRGGNSNNAFSTIEIPEDGVYSLSATYCWKANTKGASMPSSAISIDSPGNVICRVQNHFVPGFSKRGNLNRVTHLSKGNKVMVSIKGDQTSEYFLGDFQFEIEKIH